MTNTDTLDTNATVDQVIRLADAGCDIVRITAPGIKEAENLSNIKNKLIKKGYQIPLVADIHFNPKAADVAAQIVDKVRINPGNYVDRNRGKIVWSMPEIKETQERIAERLYPLIEICKKYNTAIRIGTNHGSLSERILSMYGNTPEGMVESAMEFVRIVRGFDFHNLVLSMKASNYRDMTRANLLLVDKMIDEDFYYPIHLGVTEAGNGDEARIKSAAGIGSLLVRGIGDTIRVSLAEDPVNEIPFGKKLVHTYGRKKGLAEQILTETTYLEIESDESLKSFSGVRNPVVADEKTDEADLIASMNTLQTIDSKNKQLYFKELLATEVENANPERTIFKRDYSDVQPDDLILRSAVDFGLLFSETIHGGIYLNVPATSVADTEIQDKSVRATEVAPTKLSLKVLQGLGLRYSIAEFVACPSCGRTKFHLFESFEKVKEKTAHLKGLKIAVMGCIVNGPGEMADADYGYVGAGPGKVILYKNREPIVKNIDEEKAVDALVELIKESGDWSQSK